MSKKIKAKFRSGGTIFDVLTTYRSESGRWWAVLRHPISRVEGQYPTSKLKWL